MQLAHSRAYHLKSSYYLKDENISDDEEFKGEDSEYASSLDK